MTIILSSILLLQQYSELVVVVLCEACRSISVLVFFPCFIQNNELLLLKYFLLLLNLTFSMSFSPPPPLHLISTLEKRVVYTEIAEFLKNFCKKNICLLLYNLIPIFYMHERNCFVSVMCAVSV